MTAHTAKALLILFGIAAWHAVPSASAQSQERAALQCPTGYALIGTLCINDATGDVIEPSLDRSTAVTLQCPPGHLKLDRYCLDPETGDVDEPRQIGQR